MLHKDHKNSYWSTWSACGISRMFRIPVEIVESQDSIKEAEEILSRCVFPVTLIKSLLSMKEQQKFGMSINETKHYVLCISFHPYYNTCSPLLFVSQST